MTRIYKLLSADAWRAANIAGRVDGSAADVVDGFIHFSTREQLAETARRHFSGQDDLVCLVVESDGLEALRWEPSRGGALFPHLYAPLETEHVIEVWPAPLDGHGVPIAGPARP